MKRLRYAYAAWRARRMLRAYLNDREHTVAALRADLRAQQAAIRAAVDAAEARMAAPAALPNPTHRHDARAHLDNGDLAVAAPAPGCPGCVIRPGSAA